MSEATGRVRRLATKAAATEAAGWVSMARYVGRRPRVGPDGMRLRSGPSVEVVVPWGSVDRVRVSRHGLASNASVQVAEATGPDGASGAVVSLPVQASTNAEVLLDGPQVLDLPQGPVRTSAVRFHVDDTKDWLAAVRRHLRAFDQQP